MRTDCDFCLHPECCDICPIFTESEPEIEAEEDIQN